MSRHGLIAASRSAAAGPVVAIATAAVVTAVVLSRDTVLPDEVANGGLDSAAATIGSLLGYVLLGRFWESRRVRDLLLCGFLLVLGFSNALFSAIPRAIGSEPNPGASAVAGLLAGSAFLAATWLPSWTWRGRPQTAVVLVVLAVAGALGLSVAVALAGGESGSSDTFGSTPALAPTLAQFTTAGLFYVGALGAVRSSAHDRLMWWLAGAGIIAAGSRVNFAISTSARDEWATAGTLLRLLFYASLLVAAAVEIRSYWRRVAEMAVLEERRRIARDLHDGLAQELAFAATQSRALAERSEHPRRAQLIAGATERALDESRRAIAALTRPLDEPLEVSLAQCAEEVCGRFDRSLVLDVQSGVQTSADTREALLRVVREAVSNAARHSGADEVRVRLRQADGLELRIEDDGQGFDLDDAAHMSGRLGMVSMRERVHALGGTFTVVSRLPGGTAIEVTLP